MDTKEEGKKDSTLIMIERAEAAAARQEAANAESLKILQRAEKLRAQEILGGQTEAGQVPQPKPVLSNKEYAAMVERGEANPLKEDGFI